MDRNSPDDYVETTVTGLKEVEKFVDWVEKTSGDTSPKEEEEEEVGPLVTAAIIPRFVPSCTSEMMNGLGELSRTKVKTEMMMKKKGRREGGSLLGVHCFIVSLFPATPCHPPPSHHHPTTTTTGRPPQQQVASALPPL